MRKTLGTLALVGVALIGAMSAGAGCKKASPLVGKWTTSSGASNLTIEFKPENAFAMVIKIANREFDLSGDYKLDGENLTLTPKDVNVPGLSADQMARAKAQVASGMGKSESLTAKFPTDDQLVLTNAGGGPGAAGKGAGLVGKSTTLTRVKE